MLTYYYFMHPCADIEEGKNISVLQIPAYIEDKVSTL